MLRIGPIWKSRVSARNWYFLTSEKKINILTKLTEHILFKITTNVLQVCQFFLKLLCGKPFLTRAIVKNLKQSSFWKKKHSYFQIFIIPNLLYPRCKYNLILPKREEIEKVKKSCQNFKVLNIFLHIISKKALKILDT